MAFSLDDYATVAERIHEFYDKYPAGALRTGTAPFILEAAGKQFVVYHAQAFRTPDDTHPGDGWAWEPVPGPTQFTKDSELMNAETAAWGRAIVSLGFETKKIASKEEVKARKTAAGTAAKAPAGSTEEAPPRPAESAAASANGVFATEAQRKRLFAIKNAQGVEDARLREILTDVTGQASTAGIPKDMYDAVIAAIEAEAVPFE